MLPFFSAHNCDASETSHPCAVGFAENSFDIVNLFEGQNEINSSLAQRCVKQDNPPRSIAIDFGQGVRQRHIIEFARPLRHAVTLRWSMDYALAAPKSHLSASLIGAKMNKRVRILLPAEERQDRGILYKLQPASCFALSVDHSSGNLDSAPETVVGAFERQPQDLCASRDHRPAKLRHGQRVPPCHFERRIVMG